MTRSISAKVNALVVAFPSCKLTLPVDVTSRRDLSLDLSLGEVVYILCLVEISNVLMR